MHMSEKRKIVITSQNPVKINAVKQGFSRMFPHDEFDFVAVTVPSDVSDQPMSDEETLQGASNRVHNATEKFPEADFYVGIEGGTHWFGDELVTFTWVIVQNSHGKRGRARSDTFCLPSEIAKLVRNGLELGHADEQVFATTNSKQKNGAVGLLTNDVITRTALTEGAVVLALIPFKNPELY